MTALICVPTYDERENLPILVAAVLSEVPDAHLLVVDDDSPDGTGVLADRLALEDPRVHVLHRSGKQGLAAAYGASFSWGLRHGYDVLVEMDADGSHRADELPRLLEAVRHADVVVGSRWIPGGRVEDWPLSRQVLSRAGSLYARIALGLDQRDATSGFRAYTADALRAIQPGATESDGYAFQIELLRIAANERLTVVEVPITFRDRERGQSKMSPTIAIEALVRVTRWAVRDLPLRLARADARADARASESADRSPARV